MHGTRTAFFKASACEKRIKWPRPDLNSPNSWHFVCRGTLCPTRVTFYQTFASPKVCWGPHDVSPWHYKILLRQDISRALKPG